MAVSRPHYVWIVVPAFNEAGVIGTVVGELRVAWPHVVVVDDGSGDDTGARACAAGAVVLRHPVNLGQGAALQTGIRFALAQGADLVVTFDADGQHRAEDVAVLLQTQRRTGADVVLGSRFLGAAPNMPASRRWLLKLAVLLGRIGGGPGLTDAHNGLRLLTKRAAAALRLRQNRMAHATELVSQLEDLGFRIVEAPVTVEYTPYSLDKGQRAWNALRIAFDLLLGRLVK